MIMPTVSILVRACNISRFLPEALYSIKAQNFKKWEALVLDDASTDCIKHAIAPFRCDTRIRYIQNRIRLGRAGNLNRGLALARGKYIAVLDGDDTWHDTEFLTRHISYLSTHPRVKVIAAGVQEVNEYGALRRIFPNGWLSDAAIRSHILIENIIAHHTVCYRKKDALSLGGYHTQLYYTEDYDLWLRLGLHGKFHKFHRIAGSYRIHNANIGVCARRRQIMEEMRVIIRYQSYYPFFLLGLFNRLLSLAASFLPKQFRLAIAAVLQYHRMRSQLLNHLKFFQYEHT